jgi:hypothetical protein
VKVPVRIVAQIQKTENVTVLRLAKGSVNFGKIAMTVLIFQDGSNLSLTPPFPILAYSVRTQLGSAIYPPTLILGLRHDIPAMVCVFNAFVTRDSQWIHKTEPSIPVRFSTKSTLVVDDAEEFQGRFKRHVHSSAALGVRC